MGDIEHRQRLVAILAADAAGYSRLIAQDEQATVAALDDARDVFRSAIASHHGRVVDTAGDSVLAVFETAAGAVSAAMQVQRNLEARAADVPADRQMRFRIGVHMGDVLEKADGSVYGDGVNIASRLQTLATPGGVTVSDAVRAAVRQKVAATFEDLGDQRVKNIADPVRTFAVHGQVSGAGPLKSSAVERPSNGTRALNWKRWSAGALLLALAGLFAFYVTTASKSGPGGTGPITMSVSIGSMTAPAARLSPLLA